MNHSLLWLYYQNSGRIRENHQTETHNIRRIWLITVNLLCPNNIDDCLRLGVKQDPGLNLTWGFEDCHTQPCTRGFER